MGKIRTDIERNWTLDVDEYREQLRAALNGNSEYGLEPLYDSDEVDRIVDNMSDSEIWDQMFCTNPQEYAEILQI